MGDDNFDLAPEERQAFFADFMSEGAEHLETLNSTLLEAEEALKGGSTISDDKINQMFRAAHTIKGTSSFIGLKKIFTLTHEMETVLQKVRQKDINLTEKIIDVIFQAFSDLETLFNSLRANGTEEGNISDSINLIQEILSPGEAKPAAAEEAKAEEKAEEAAPPSEPKLEEIPEVPLNEKYIDSFLPDLEQNIETFNDLMVTIEQKKSKPELINDIFRTMHTIKGSAGIVNAVRIQALAHSMETLLSYYRDSKKTISEDAGTLLFKGIDTIKEASVNLQKEHKEYIRVAALCRDLEECHLIESGKKKAPSKKAASQKASSKKTGNKKAALTDNNIYTIQLTVMEGIPLKSVKIALLESNLQKKGELSFISPDSASADDDKDKALPIHILFTTTHTEKDIEKFLALDGVRIDEIERVDIEGIREAILAQEAEETEDSEQETAASVPDAPPDNKPETENITKAEKESPMTTATPPSAPSKAAQQTSSAAAKSGFSEVSTIRIDSNKLDILMNLSGELTIIRARFAQILISFLSEISTQKEIRQNAEEAKALNESLLKDLRRIQAKTQNGIQGDLKLLGKNMDELSKTLSEMHEKVSASKMMSSIHDLDEVTDALEKVSGNIQSGVMQTRMVPVEGIFTRFKRVVRDISKDLGKDVNLVIEGEDTELDKKIVDSLGDPLTHMIRNSVDHGIEDAETRKKLGKPENGTVILKASHKGNNICIEIGDDGKGLDADRIAMKAYEKGLVSEDQLKSMNEKDKLHLIFLPGFSTAEKVTGLSGRGVGMDVVKNMLNTVKGDVDIITEKNKGSRFVLKIPLTLSIIQALLVVIGDEAFAIPIEAITEIIKVSHDNIYAVDGTDTIKLRGHALSVVELARVIGIKAAGRSTDDQKRIVVITDGEQRLGIIVDSLIGQEEIVIKPISKHFSKVKGISGASILGDGSISLILDHARIIKEAK